MIGRILAAAALAATLAALATGSTLLLRSAYVLWGVVVVAWILAALSLRSLDIVRETRARRGQVGGYAEERLELRNRSWLPKLWIELHDESTLPDHRVGRVVSSVGPGQVRGWTVRTMCRRRGSFTLGPMALVGGDPLGLFESRRELPATAAFVVYPLTVPLRGVDLPSGYLTGGQVIRRRAEFTTTNVRGVRPYVPGEALSRVHWPTTARRGQLYSKEFELDPLADVWVLLDMERSAHAGEADEADDAAAPVVPWIETPELTLDPTTEEHAVAIAASLARHFLDGGKSVGLIAYGQRRIVVRPDRGERQVNKLLETLAVMRAAGREPLAQVLSTESPELTRQTTLVVITPTTTLRWIEALRALGQRGVRAWVVHLDASSFGAAAPPGPVLAALAASGIPVRPVRRGDDLAAALQRA